MLICGVKVTHDAAVALIDGNRLVFSVEMEKLEENPRYSEIHDADQIASTLGLFGLEPKDVDLFVIDGWGRRGPWGQLPEPSEYAWVQLADCGATHRLVVGDYEVTDPTTNVAALTRFDGLPIKGERFAYRSGSHVLAHVLGSYCASPFARRKQDAHVLVWDGGIDPSMYYVSAAGRAVRYHEPLFRLHGKAYGQFARAFPPYRDSTAPALSIAGKAMAYVAKGQARAEIRERLQRELLTSDRSGKFGLDLGRSVLNELANCGFDGADFVRTFHELLQDMLCAALRDYAERRRIADANLCLSGGCALNIKWNSAIRNLGLFAEVFVPPFPNNSGNALGAACAAMFESQEHPDLGWSVYAGPPLREEPLRSGWSARESSIDDLAELLHESNEPVVFLSGRAELGPRALGHRSILASATDQRMKSTLNAIKRREAYRPVAPVCLEDRASEIFEPGDRDPYMLFDHRVRPLWVTRIPAVLHLDGTARLQTVSDADNPLLARLLRAYERLSGVPVLCNTSANRAGMGFFPSVAAAARWGGTNFIWSDGVVYERMRRRSLGL